MAFTYLTSTAFVLLLTHLIGRRRAQTLSTPSKLDESGTKEGEPFTKTEAVKSRSFSANGLLRNFARDRDILLDLNSPETQDQVWLTLQPLGEQQATFTYWGCMKVQKKLEVSSMQIVEELSNPKAFSLLFPSQQDAITSGSSIHPLTSIYIQPNFSFPLSPDHKLLALIQYNVLRGAMTNMIILCQLNNIPFTGWEDFQVKGLPTPQDAPPSLQPTRMQQERSHEAWIDIIPYPRVRDNLIEYHGKFDVDDFCNDFCGGGDVVPSGTERHGLIVWGDPWSGSEWEMSESFARKWSFLVEGCADLENSTNKWREMRGEERIVLEIDE